MNLPGYIIATEIFVDAMISDLKEPSNQGPNFNARTFMIGELTAAFLRGDEVIGATEEDLQTAANLARERWADAWGFDLSEFEIGE